MTFGSTNATDPLLAYPVGSIYISINSTNPGDLFGGTWVAFSQGRILIGAGTYTDKQNESRTFTVGMADDGEYKHTLTVDEMPSHTHTVEEYNFVQSPAFSYWGRDDDGGASEDPETTSGLWRTRRKANDEGNTGSDDYMYLHFRDRHTHTVQPTGGNLSHNNVQPFMVVYIWKRTA